MSNDASEEERRTHHSDKDDCVARLTFLVHLADPLGARKDAVASDSKNEARRSSDSETRVLRRDVTSPPSCERKTTHDEQSYDRYAGHDHLTALSESHLVDQHERLRSVETEKNVQVGRAEEEEDDERLCGPSQLRVRDLDRKQLTNAMTPLTRHDQNIPRAEVRLAFLVSSAMCPGASLWLATRTIH